MDTSRFDAFVRSFTSVVPRRIAVGGLARIGLAALITWLGTDAAGAKKKRKKKKCKGGKKRCGKSCANLATNGDHCGACGHACVLNGCLHGACTCNTGVECPEGCFCGSNNLGVKACNQSFSPVGQPCTVDDDCPLRSYCSPLNTCTIPCPL